MSKANQFKHNLNKAKRQAKNERAQIKDSTEALRDLFADFGNIYVVKPKN